MAYDIKTASEAMLASIPKRSAAVLEKRFGLAKSGKRFTLEAIGNSYGITRERVRQIEADGLNRIRKASEFSNLEPLFLSFTEYIKQQGGIVAESQLFSHFSNENVPSEAVRFLLTLHPNVIYRGESDIWHSRWGLDGIMMDSIEHALQRVSDVIKLKEETIAYEQLANMMQKELAAESVATPSHAILSAYIAISKQIDKNYFNQWGHTSSSLVRPRGVRDLAYLVFQQAGAPMHFSAAAERIREVATARRVHAQTVHNELIKDNRFVLVGRGMYGLSEWGYEPGTVQDIIIRALSSGPLSKDALVEKVLHKRQVKENTILINLQNRKRFKKFSDGTYGNVV
ncbi:MAG: hypothetical protein A2719_01420 [Candidatus Ryanbacteria bacterium RIFCSPHIGHO2_01_FULL_45_22]|uniref:HTH HARE-type domain-containing protein n=2 Tax=Candidatus Ryaniibacteriota TaxID=1817914 RepID=A0A1G2G091_9BACT|nr:MAG: hypothetical protein A2719_01420 [Candidatus Ryanbacteria bacterium RIFCSPHIGHO2_01_FULL_45_22]OGZ46383.1 MAG: hypothetical protein A3J54_04305 [Candidatus Ryanbacteria bacterium RIFCSPHIGHO2_02_FULL_45_13b]